MADEFPIAFADGVGGAAAGAPEEADVGEAFTLTVEVMEQIDGVEAVAGGDAGGGAGGGEDVERRDDGGEAGRFEAAGPGDDEGDTDAALVELTFAAAEGGVGGGGDVGGAAVVGEEEDEVFSVRLRSRRAWRRRPTPSSMARTIAA